MLVAVSVCQISPSVSDSGNNLATIRSAVESAAGEGAGIVVLPELANSGYMFESGLELRQSADGKTVQVLIELAARYRIVVVAGMAESCGGHVYNSAVLVDETGLRTCYRKVHLWDAEKETGFAAGTARPPVIDTRFGRIGVMICYDLEFPEWVRLVALDGADMLCVPANWPLQPRPANERPTEVVRAQALASINRMFIAIADRTGEERGQSWLGGSVIVNADGYPVTRLRFGEEAILASTVDLADARNKNISPRNNVLSDRRPELY